MSKKVSFSIEYNIQASPQLLFQYLSTPSGLSEWFADNVNSRGEIYTFIWDGSEEVAKLIQIKANEKVKFQWQTGDEDEDWDNDGSSNSYENIYGTDSRNASDFPSDIDGDGIPDEYDGDKDGDGYYDGDDAFPRDENEWFDTDGDGTGNNADLDDVVLRDQIGRAHV